MQFLCLGNSAVAQLSGLALNLSSGGCEDDGCGFSHLKAWLWLQDPFSWGAQSRTSKLSRLLAGLFHFSPHGPSLKGGRDDLLQREWSNRTQMPTCLQRPRFEVTLYNFRNSLWLHQSTWFHAGKDFTGPEHHERRIRGDNKCLAGPIFLQGKYSFLRHF